MGRTSLASHGRRVGRFFLPGDDPPEAVLSPGGQPPGDPPSGGTRPPSPPAGANPPVTPRLGDPSPSPPGGPATAPAVPMGYFSSQPSICSPGLGGGVVAKQATGTVEGTSPTGTLAHGTAEVHHHGKPLSWVAISVIIVGFLV